VTTASTVDGERRFDVLGIGCSAVDERLFVSHFPAPDGKARVLRRDTTLGGLTAVALVAAARMGARTAYAGRLGSDELSQFVERALQKQGVVTRDVVRCDNACPGRSTILIDESTGTRAVLSEVLGLRGADDTRPPAELIQQSRVLCLDGHGVAGSIRAARIARDSGCWVVADIEREHDGDFDILFDLVDHLIVPEAFALTRTGCTEPAAAAIALLDVRLDRAAALPKRAAVVVTCGSRGGYYCAAGGEPTPYPAYRVVARDTTGCGDVFHGVYAAGLAFGWDMDQRIRWAAAAAALKAASAGGPDAVPDRSRVQAATLV